MPDSARPEGERRSLPSRRRRDHIVTPLRIASLAAPTLIMVVLLLMRGQTVNPDYVTLLTVTTSLTTALVVLRNQTMHLGAQDAMLVEQQHLLRQQSATLSAHGLEITETKYNVNSRLSGMIQSYLAELVTKAAINAAAVSAQGQGAPALGAALNSIQALSTPAVPASPGDTATPGSVGDIQAIVAASAHTPPKKAEEIV